MPMTTTPNTMIKPKTPALFLLNLRQATAHWLADRLLGVGFVLLLDWVVMRFT
jgi:hypothetical protein